MSGKRILRLVIALVLSGNGAEMVRAEMGAEMGWERKWGQTRLNETRFDPISAIRLND